MADQAEVTRWAGLVAAGYTEGCALPLSPLDLRDLMAELDDPLADCIMLAIPPNDWDPHFVNPILGRWEAKVRRPRGPRSEVADYSHGRVTMI